MAYSAAVSARNAANDRTNAPGMCLQQTRMWCGINSRYPDASTAWRNTNDRHPGNRNPPRGAAVYWTGGSKGYGHIGLSMGSGKVRSTDAGGRGRVATVEIGWVERNWGLKYAGWAWDINETTIPHQSPKPAAAAAKGTNWSKVRDDLLKTLNSSTAKEIAKPKVKKFIADTKKAIAALPKE
jgi:hypothetical protein